MAHSKEQNKYSGTDSKETQAPDLLDKDLENCLNMLSKVKKRTQRTKGIRKTIYKQSGEYQQTDRNYFKKS